MQTPIILSDTHYDKWLNSLELVLPFGDLWPYYWCGLKWLINYLTHASKKLGHRHQPNVMLLPQQIQNILSHFCPSVQCFVGHADECAVLLLQKKRDLAFMQTGDCHHSSDDWPQDGIWKESISGVISFLKANEFPDNKMVGWSQGLVIVEGNHVLCTAPTEQLQIVMIAGRFL